MVEDLPDYAEYARDTGWIFVLGKSSGVGHPVSTPIFLENT